MLQSHNIDLLEACICKYTGLSFVNNCLTFARGSLLSIIEQQSFSLYTITLENGSYMHVWNFMTLGYQIWICML